MANNIETARIKLSDLDDELHGALEGENLMETFKLLKLGLVKVSSIILFRVCNHLCSHNAYTLLRSTIHYLENSVEYWS